MPINIGRAERPYGSKRGATLQQRIHRQVAKSNPKRRACASRRLLAHKFRPSLARTEVLELLGRCGRHVLDSDWSYWYTYENFEFECAIVYLCAGSALLCPAEDLQLGCEQRRNGQPGPRLLSWWPNI